MFQAHITSWISFSDYNFWERYIRQPTIKSIPTSAIGNAHEIPIRQACHEIHVIPNLHFLRVFYYTEKYPPLH